MIRVGDVMRFKPTMGRDSPQRRIMYALVVRITEREVTEKACECLMLFDSFELDRGESDWPAGSVVLWPYSYLNDLESWQKVTP